MIPKALLDCSTDPELRPKDLHVYVFLHAHLGYYDFRPIKHAWLVRKLNQTRENLSRALTRLTANGYLERQKQRGGAVAYYRMPLSPKEKP